MRRLFVALPLTDVARHALAASLAGVELPGRPVAPADWHVTLRFIGNADPPTVETVIHALDEAPLGEAFALSWGGLGAFPRPRRATVLWLGISEGENRLEELADDVDDALAGAGLEARDLPFRAHLTLSRVRPPADVEPTIGSLEPAGVRMPCKEVVLMESDLAAQRGHRYRTVEVFPLG